MKDFSGRIAVITGGGNGIGRALALLLAEEGCSLALCDVRAADLEETAALARALAPQGVRISTFVADVSVEDQVLAFRDAVIAVHETSHVNLLFNNAGISGGGSFVSAPRAEWDRVFGVCWHGVYNNARAFLPLLIKADAAHLINVSSVNGFWASLGPDTAHTAYSAAKFAVKGFSEALINDLRLNAPHVKVSLVMPGHIGTRIAANSVEAQMNGVAMPDDIRERVEAFEANGLAPKAAAQIILDGVRDECWRILVGPDAILLDRAVRADPENVYGMDMATLVAAALKAS